MKHPETMYHTPSLENRMKFVFHDILKWNRATVSVIGKTLLVFLLQRFKENVLDTLNVAVNNTEHSRLNYIRCQTNGGDALQSKR